MATITILSWNVNGIRSVEKKGFADWLIKAQPDVLGLQEVKAKESEIPEPVTRAKGYTTHWNPAEKAGYSGVGVLLKTQPKSITKGFGIQKFDCEGRVIQMDFGKFVLFNIYFPNGGDGNKRVPYKLEFYGELLKYCEALKKKGKGVIIGGDFNTAHKEIDLKNPKANEKSTGFLPEERAWIDKYLSHGYVDIFRKFNDKPGQYSYWTYMFNARKNNAGWRIDYFLVSEDLVKDIKNAYILPEVMGSDHCPVGIDVKM